MSQIPAAPEGGAAPVVERFNSPTGKRGVALILFNAAAAVAMSFVWAQGFTEMPAKLIAAVVGAGLWAAVVAPLWFRGNVEVTFGPGVLVARSWSDVLRRKPGPNAWVEPGKSWLWRGRRGVCLVQPDGPRLGRQSRRLVEAFERAGFTIKDDGAVWERSHPRRRRVAAALVGLGFIVACTAAALGYAKNAVEPDNLLLTAAGFGLVLLAALVLFHGAAPLQDQSSR